MKVKDLIKSLKKLDQELPVVLSKDPEGNDFRYLEGAYDGVFTGRELLEVYNPEDAPKGAKPCVILWPM